MATLRVTVTDYGPKFQKRVEGTPAGVWRDLVTTDEKREALLEMCSALVEEAKSWLRADLSSAGQADAVGAAVENGDGDVADDGAAVPPGG